MNRTVPFVRAHHPGGFGTPQGLSRIIPEADRPESPLPIFISGLRVSGIVHRLSELGEVEVPELRLGSNENQIQIDSVGGGQQSAENQDNLLN
ncbi:MAG: hypothetical protein HY650_00260 [Acidobacteria bacterium]|nr:hypothetical protein [Acidobacteriota bacterium]